MTSDIEIQEDVLDELRLDPSIDASRVSVAVNDGIVSFTGWVNSYAEKAIAEEIAKRVYGVRGVADDLEVKLPAANVRTDPEIASAAVNALKWNMAVPDERIKVTVEKGWVTLEGTVDWNYQRNAADRAIHLLTGVRAVKNLIKVTPKVVPSDVREQIENCFKRNAELDARRIGVKAHEGKVRLHGNVRTWAEKEEAQRAVWSVPGVREVENDLHVLP